METQKGTVHMNSDLSTSAIEQDTSDGVTSAEMEFDEKLCLKIDRHILAPMFVLNFLAIMGRGNIGMALIQGVVPDLHLDAVGVFLVVSMPAIPLILTEIPSNLLMRFLERKWGLAYIRYLGILDIILGIVTLGQGFDQTYEQFLVTRLLVGIFDAGLIPGCVFVLSLYYPGIHLQWRLSMIMVANICAIVVGNLLAYGIAMIDSPNGYNGWRWIFIIEGCFTMLAGLLVCFSSIGLPSKSTFLTPNEKAIIASNIETRKTTIGLWAEWKIFLTTPTNYAWAALSFFTLTTTNAISTFAPTFVQSFHRSYSIPQVQGQVVPIFAVAAFACLLVAWLADRFDHRSCLALVGYALVIAGYGILSVPDRDARTADSRVTMAALYFIGIGTCVVQPMVWNLTVLNLATPFQRAIGVGAVIGVGNVAGFVAAWWFRTSEGPLYRNGMRNGLVVTCVAFGLLAGTTIYMAVRNRRIGKMMGEKRSGKILKYRV